MINFGELELRDGEHGEYSFVGIKKEGSRLIFHIPKGFSQSDSSLNTFDSKRDLFFRLYRMLNVFKQICIDKEHFKTGVVIKADDRDGIVEDNEDDTGSEIISDKHRGNIFYSKIDALRNILDVYDELKIFGFVTRLGQSKKLDYSKLHRFLNKATFLNNGAIYIDSMNLPRKETNFTATDIVAMYCYIFTEIKEQLKQAVNPEINALSERFKENYLGLESSLFNEKYYLQVINELKDALELIDHYTPIKDNDYWDFYEAIYKFLFGDLDNSIQGKVWGFSNFNTIWESMCLNYLVKTVDPAFILYLDKQFISDKILNEWNNCNKIIDISGIFRVNGTDIFPDAVIIPNLMKQNKILISYQLAEQGHWDKVKNQNIYYYTQFSYKAYASYHETSIKIAYLQQPGGYHTFNELKKIFPTNNSYITITSSLPNKFYSYWETDYWKIPNELIHKEIQMMCNLNHIFVVAINNRFLDFKDFYKKYLEPCEIFTTSLLRDSGGKENIEKLFQKFIQFIWRQFNIIDIKYHDHDYFSSHKNIEKIKKDSIRKQFVYEYLLQKHIKDTKSQLKELDIKSEFWLPASSSHEETFTPMPKYMDDYIKLTGVNIVTVIDSYLETEEK